MRTRRNVLGTGAIAALVALGGLAVPVGAQASTLGTITGRVTNSVTHDPVEGAKVCAVQGVIQVECRYTEENGEYTLPGLEVGDYYVTVSREGYALGETAAEIEEENETVEGVNITLEELGALEGRVTTVVGHHDVSGAEVCAVEPSAVTEQCTTTDVHGQYKFTGLTPGEYIVYASEEDEEPEYAPGEALVTVSPGEAVPALANVELGELGKITGTVTGAGALLEEVRVCTASGPTEACTYTNAAGEYTLKHLEPGSYKIYFEGPETRALDQGGLTNFVYQFWNDKPDYEAAEAISVSYGEVIEHVDATLAVGGHISGKVTNAANGQPIAGTLVCAETLGAPYYEGCARTNSAGEYTITGLGTGAYGVFFYGGVCLEVDSHSTCTTPWLPQDYQALVSVTAPGTVSGINVALVARGHEKPVSTSPPAITGAATVGSTLTCSQGAWGNLPTAFAYQWLRNGVAIAGQTATTYTVAIADEGTSLSCTVTATDPAGSTAATSTALAIAKPTPGVAAVTGVSVKGAKASVTLKCTGQTACLGKLELLVRVNVRGHGKHKKNSVHNVVIGSAALLIVANTSNTVQVHLDSAGQKLLHTAGRKGLKVEFTGSGVTTATKTVK